LLRERASQNSTIYLIPLFTNHCKSGFDWAACAGLIVRWCPFCWLDSIIGHGWRRKQAHDDSHDWIRYRRGQCPLCGVIFSFLPAFSLPYTHYSLVARREGLRRRFVEQRYWEDPAPLSKILIAFPIPPPYAAGFTAWILLGPPSPFYTPCCKLWRSYVE
jgi:hypothetical protein